MQLIVQLDRNSSTYWTTFRKISSLAHLFLQIKPTFRPNVQTSKTREHSSKCLRSSVVSMSTFEMGRNIELLE